VDKIQDLDTKIGTSIFPSQKNGGVAIELLTPKVQWSSVISTLRRVTAVAAVPRRWDGCVISFRALPRADWRACCVHDLKRRGHRHATLGLTQHVYDMSFDKLFLFVCNLLYQLKIKN
jgi:hypothetical protein